MGGKGSGRKTKPVEVHMANGTYNVTRHRNLEPEKRGAGAPLTLSPPIYLDAYACSVWGELIASVTNGGLITENERHLFGLYCQAVGQAQRALEEMQTTGPIEEVEKYDEKMGRVIRTKRLSPWQTIYRDALADVARLGAQLGMTSVDRSKVIKSQRAQGLSPAGQPKSRPKTALDELGGNLRLLPFGEGKAAPPPVPVKPSTSFD